jgi:predicted SAM-dependent methyltransferase
MYVQYGCGLSAPQGWLNFDASPTLRIQRIPVIGKTLSQRKVIFPDNVKYGNILKRLPGIAYNSCDGIYCSHVLEHLSLHDCRKAIEETYNLLKPGGIFRCVLPDLETYIRDYNQMRNAHNPAASMHFMNQSLLGLTERPKGIKGLMVQMMGNSHHLWMWDQYSLTVELQEAGFTSVRSCSFNDSSDEQFKMIEEASRFEAAFALEAIK